MASWLGTSLQESGTSWALSTTSPSWPAQNWTRLLMTNKLLTSRWTILALTTYQNSTWSQFVQIWSGSWQHSCYSKSRSTSPRNSVRCTKPMNMVLAPKGQAYPLWIHKFLMHHWLRRFCYCIHPTGHITRLCMISLIWTTVSCFSVAALGTKAQSHCLQKQVE